MTAEPTSARVRHALAFPIETPRLIIRSFEVGDAEMLHERVFGDEETMKFIPRGASPSVERTRGAVERFIRHEREHGFGLWATTYKKTDQLIGRCGLIPWTIDGRSEVEVAYLLARAHWGRGLGTEAARAILTYGFEQAHLTRLICLIDPANTASVNVAVKIGMSLERDTEIDGERTLVYSAAQPA